MPPVFKTGGFSRGGQEALRFDRIALRLVEGDRVWVCQTYWRGRTHRVLCRRANHENDATHKASEAREQKGLVAEHKQQCERARAERAAEFDADY